MLDTIAGRASRTGPRMLDPAPEPEPEPRTADGAILFVETAANRTMKENRQTYLVRVSAFIGGGPGMNVLVALPRGETISRDAEIVHGMMRNYERDVGHVVTASEAISQFAALAGRATLMVGHAVDFHARLLRRTAERTETPLRMPAEYCTMRHATPIVGLRHTGGQRLKWPKLTEAYQFFARGPLDLPADPWLAGMVTVRAVKTVYDGIGRAGGPR